MAKKYPVELDLVSWGVVQQALADKYVVVRSSLDKHRSNLDKYVHLAEIRCAADAIDQQARAMSRIPKDVT